MGEDDELECLEAAIHHIEEFRNALRDIEDQKARLRMIDYLADRFGPWVKVAA